jgi:hypothetical protein
LAPTSMPLTQQQAGQYLAACTVLDAAGCRLPAGTAACRSWAPLVVPPSTPHKPQVTSAPLYTARTLPLQPQALLPCPPGPRLWCWHCGPDICGCRENLVAPPVSGSQTRISHTALLWFRVMVIRRFLFCAPVFLTFPPPPPLLFFALNLPCRLAVAAVALSGMVNSDLPLLLFHMIRQPC